MKKRKKRPLDVLVDARTSMWSRYELRTELKRSTFKHYLLFMRLGFRACVAADFFLVQSDVYGE